MAEEAALSSLKRVLDALDTYLASNTLLVGNSVTLADIVTMCNLYIGFTQLMTKSFISEFPYVERYFWTMVNQPNFKKVLGEVKQISLFPVTKKHLSQKNLLNQILRMNPKKRNQQSPNQNLVRKRRVQSPNLRILLIYCPQANGSARVRLEQTDVVSSVKAELGKPSSLQPNKGKVAIHVDCSPSAAPMFEGRGGEELSTELLVALQHCLLGAKSGAGAGIDLSSLIVAEGKFCWDLYIDCLVVCSDGYLLDALGSAIKAALSNTGIPRVRVAVGALGDEKPKVDISEEEFLQFDT